MKTEGCKAGVYMLMTEDSKKIANELLSNGYIEINEETLKIYLDPFAISFRNGLYYEQTQDFSYTTDYDADDYMEFLWGNDNQLNYEDQNCLGYQNRTLKNPNMNFNKIFRMCKIKCL